MAFKGTNNLKVTNPTFNVEKQDEPKVEDRNQYKSQVYKLLSNTNLTKQEKIDLCNNVDSIYN